jgi:dihydropteroate synthase
LQREGALVAAAATGLPICLMHMQGQPNTMQQQPHYQSVVDEVQSFLQQRIDACLAVGIAREQLLLDVGFGFGKTLAHNLELLRRLAEFEVFAIPILVGMSRKSMLGAILGGAPVNERLFAGVGAATIAVINGASIVRTHDVKATKEAIAVAFAVKNLELTIT